MMRADIANAVKDILSGTGAFATVSGIGCDKPSYPLARVWIPGCPKENLDNAPQARIDLRVAVQVETFLTESNGLTDDAPLYDLVDTAFAALHNQQLPGRGSQPLIVYDSPGLGEYRSDGPAVYLLQVSVRVLPDAFSLTL